MELLVAVTILVIMMGLIAPVLTGVHEGNKLRAAAREIVALLKYARTEAVMGERTTEVFLDLEKREFWLDLREPDPKTGNYRSEKGKKTQLEHKRSLSEGMWFDEVSAYDNNIIKRDKLIAIDFFADGSASPTFVTVAGRNGKKMTIEVLKSSGMTELSAGTIEEKKASQGSAPPPAPGAVPGRSS
jgi:type II secretory pathway pseudopilin PulG